MLVIGVQTSKEVLNLWDRIGHLVVGEVTVQVIDVQVGPAIVRRQLIVFVSTTVSCLGLSR